MVRSVDFCRHTPRCTSSSLDLVDELIRAMTEPTDPTDLEQRHIDAGLLPPPHLRALRRLM